MNLRRLWRPERALFWLMLVFNALSSLCAWAMRWPQLSPTAVLVVGVLALGNVAPGLLAAWRLMQDE